MLLVIVGLVIGFVIGYIFFQERARSQAEQTKGWAESSKTELVKEYEGKLRDQSEQHQKEVERVRKESVEQSRYTLKGKITEQMAPLLKGFEYQPADARFLGSPVDYVVFKGYNLIRDRGEGWEDLEIVILDVKQGSSHLSPTQQAIKQAIENGRVCFEIVHVREDGTVAAPQKWQVRRLPGQKVQP